VRTRPTYHRRQPARLPVSRWATCQFPVEHDIDRNIRQILDLIRLAAAAGADVAHFPECALSDYGPSSWPDWEGFAWSAVEGAIDAIRDEARAKGIWVVTGTVHRANAQARPTNSLLVLDRHGAIAGRYDKRRCSINDLRVFAPGDRQLIVDIEGVRCGFLICLDWAFPEPSRWACAGSSEGEVELLGRPELACCATL
jgi:predicted amidohydrolase